MANQFSSSTSPVLKDPDLLQIIFEYFDLENLECIMSQEYSLDQCRTRQSLLWAALTSRAFLEPAMNVLWREMESILPLYLVLPALREEEDDDDDEDLDDDKDDDDDSDEGSESDYTPTEPLNGDDVQRMVFYARRIRSLHFHYEEHAHSNLHLGLFMAFFTRINQLNAFLSLRELVVNTVIGFQYTTLCTISPPNLSLLQLSLSPQEESMTNSILESLACESPHIKTLSVEGNHTVLGVLPKFSRVQNLTIYVQNLPVVSLSLLEQIASSMASLQSLEMQLDSSQVKNDQKNSPLQFISLTDLVVDGHLRTIGNFLEVVHAPLLCRLSLAIGFPGPGFDICTPIRSFIPVKMVDKV